MAKESKKKSGQATDKKYVSGCFTNNSSFLDLYLMATTKSRHSISTQNKDFDDSVSHSENELLKKKDPKNYHC